MQDAPSERPAASADPDLSVAIGSLRMKNPVTVASGTFGYGREYEPFFDLRELGAVTCKGIRLAPCEGNAQPRIAEVRGGMLNAIGLQGPGVDAFVATALPFLRERGVPAIVNIWGTSEAEYAEVARRLSDAEGVGAIYAETLPEEGLGASVMNRPKKAAGFDIDPAIIGTEIGGKKVYHISELNDVCSSEGIRTGIITVPEKAAVFSPTPEVISKTACSEEASSPSAAGAEYPIIRILSFAPQRME